MYSYCIDFMDTLKGYVCYFTFNNDKCYSYVIELEKPENMSVERTYARPTHIFSVVPLALVVQRLLYKFSGRSIENQDRAL
jgi:hypothetical protein